MAKHPNAVIQRSDLKGLEVAPSVGGNIFGSIKCEELLLGLSSHALTKLTVHTLCSIIRIARREGVFVYLLAKITRFKDGMKNAKAVLEKILEHSPSINRKCHVSRLVFLARLSVVLRMESNYLSNQKRIDNPHFPKDSIFSIAFDDVDLKVAVLCCLNILKKALKELKIDDKSKKRKIATITDTITDERITTEILSDEESRH
jgi:hypothetical protein